MAQAGNIVANLQLKVDQFRQGMKDARSELTNFSETTRNVADGVGKAFAAVSIATGTALTAMGVGAVKAAADAETQLAAMETAMQGNTKAAQEYFNWAKDFAKATPFESSEVVDATIKLKSYGIEAKDSLETIGNMAAGMGKGLDQAVEAVADAQTGELERLKEFGITKQMLIDEALKLGKGEIVNAKGQITDMDALNESLLSIMDKRFKGGMERQSKTFNGQLSALKDNWTNFLAAIGNELMVYLKPALENLNKWIATLDFGAIASQVGAVIGSLINVFLAIGHAISSTAAFIQENKTLLLTLAGVITAVVLPALLGFIFHAGVLKAKALWGLITNTVRLIAFNYALGLSYLAAYAPILLVIAGIGLLVAGFMLWNGHGDAMIAKLESLGINMEGFRLFIEGVRLKLAELWLAFQNTAVFALLAEGVSLVVGKFQELWTAIQNLITSGDFTPLIQAVQFLIPTILGILIGGIPRLLIMGATLIQNLADGMGITVPQLITKIADIIVQMINSFVAMLPSILEMGIQFIMSIINGILQSLPQIIIAITQVVTVLLSTLTTLLPIILTAGIQILMALISGILKILPTLISTAVKLIVTIVAALVGMLPKILAMGIKLLLTLITGILKVLPQLITAAIGLIIAIVNALIKALPQIIAAGIKILNALIKGIIQVLPLLIAAAVKLVIAIVKALIQNMPLILSAGVKLIGALIKGVLSLLGAVGKAALDIGKEIWNKIKSIDLADVGSDLIKGLWKGISNMGSWIKGKIGGFTSGIVKDIKGFFGIHSPSRLFRDEIGVNLMKGLQVGIEIMKKAPIKSMAGVAENVLSGAQSVKGAFEGLGNIRMATPQVGSMASGIANVAFGEGVGSVGGGGTNYNAPIVQVENMHVRDDRDVRNVSRELFGLQRSHDRAKGGR